MAVNAHHQKRFETVRKKALAALKKGAIRVQARQAVRYGPWSAAALARARPDGGAEFMISREGQSHISSSLQNVRSKLLRLANAPPFDDWQPQSFFEQLLEAGRVGFEKMEFVRAVQAAFDESATLEQDPSHSMRRQWQRSSDSGAGTRSHSEFDREQCRLALITRHSQPLEPIAANELIELFVALDVDCIGVVGIEELGAFVFGGAVGSDQLHRYHGHQLVWQYPLPYGRWETAPRMLQLDLSLTGAAPQALVISWQTQLDNFANAEDSRAARTRPRQTATGGGGLAACCAAPEQHSPESLAATSSIGGNAGARTGRAVEVSVRVNLSEIRRVVFGAARPGMDPEPAAGAASASAQRVAAEVSTGIQGGHEHWKCFSIHTDETRWDFSCKSGHDARACFLALQSAIAGSSSSGGSSNSLASISHLHAQSQVGAIDRLWGRLLWHTARTRLHTLAAVMRVPHTRALAQVLEHPRQPRLRQPIERMKHKTLAEMHSKKATTQEKRQQQQRLVQSRGDDSDWVDGAWMHSSKMLVGQRLDVEGYGRGTVISTSVDSHGDTVHTLRFEHDSNVSTATQQLVTLKLDSEMFRHRERGNDGSGLPFMVEVAKLL